MKTLNILNKLNRGKRACALFALYAATAMVVSGQTLTTLHSFDGTDGMDPLAGLIQATDGNLYGTTSDGGAGASGTVFKITTGGTLTTIYNFCAQSGCTDGAAPQGALVQAADGDFYGTTAEGGASDGGTVFKITPSGTLTTLYSFCSQSGCLDGQAPQAPLVLATNGDFYGTAHFGGVYICSSTGCGTVFKITPGGTLTTLYTFCSQGSPDCPDGANPNGLIGAANGDLYGTTEFGGTGGRGGAGTVFKITPGGTLTTLYSFCSQSKCADGALPVAGLVQGANGDFYGTTWQNGANRLCGENCPQILGGTVFKIAPSGTLTTLYSFCDTPEGSGCPDGGSPADALVRATNGDFYGTTPGKGTIFKITSGGTLKTLEKFDFTDGAGPLAGLVQATNGIFYGTTQYGGANCAPTDGCGTVFSLSVGLGPFVETQTTSGEVRAAVNILGTNLTGATGVTFNGTPAGFTVVSSSLIATTVPAGASTGKVEVAIAGSGTLSSNAPFRVLP